MAEGEQSRQRRVISTSTTSEQDLYNIMDDIYDKLVILNYHHNFCIKTELNPISHTYFATQGPPQVQFQYFVSLVMWLFEEIGHSVYGGVSSVYDNAHEQSNTIYLEIKKLGFESLDFAATHLRSGWGMPVCKVLSFLLDQALQIKNFKVEEPKFEVTEMDDPHDEKINEIDEILEDDEMKDTEDEINDFHKPSIIDEIYSQIPQEDAIWTHPVEWKNEKERVAPYLKADTEYELNEWRTHLNRTNQYHQEIKTEFPNSRHSLLIIGEEIRKSSEKIKTKEKILNRDFENLIKDYQEKKVNIENLHKQHRALSDQVQELEFELKTKNSEIEKVKEKIQALSGTHTDYSPIFKAKEVLKTMIQEQKDLELRIGILYHTLLRVSFF